PPRRPRHGPGRDRPEPRADLRLLPAPATRGALQARSGRARARQRAPRPAARGLRDDQLAMTPSDVAPYETLARSLERELELLGEGAYAELEALHAERATLLAGLPATPPAPARPALQRAALMNKRVEMELLRRREALLHEASTVLRVERTARGYAPAAENRPHVRATA